MLADGRPKIVIIVSLTFQNCCVTFYLSIIFILQITGKLLRDIAAKAATPILIRAAVCELYMKFFTSLYHIIFFYLFFFLFLFYRPKTIIRRNRINQEQKSRHSYSPISLARNWDFPVCICNPMQIAGVACRFRYRVQNTVVR